MQFIAVTTKDGAVFYILINYSADSENSVYFLNKVDTFDLYSLLYMRDDEKEKGIDLERAKQAEESALNREISEKSEESETEYEIEEIAVQPTTDNMKIAFILLGAVVLAGVGFARFKLLKKPKNKPVEISEEDDEDYNFYDEEINEDDE